MHFQVIILLISLLFSLVIRPNEYSIIDYSYLLLISMFGIFNIFVFLKYIKNQLHTWINFHTFFLIGFFIVFFQIPFLSGFGVMPESPGFIWINTNVVNYGTWVSLVGLLFWILGNYISSFKLSRSKILSSNNLSLTMTKTSLMDFLLLFVFIIFIVLVGQAFLSGNYDGGKNWGTGASYVNILLKSIVLVRTVYFFRNYYLKRINKKTITFKKYLFNNKIYAIVFILYVLLFSNAGDRGPIIELGLLILALYSFYIKRIKIMNLIILIILGSVVLTILRFGRGAIADDRNIIERGLEGFNDNSELNFTDELASSVRIQYSAVDIVPKHGYLYGITMLSDLTTTIPFGNRYFIELTGLPEIYRSSTYFFTIINQGQFYSYGEGSAIIGDIYINFGLLGVIVLMTLYGYIIFSMSYKGFVLGQYTPLLIVFLLITTSIYINRSVLFYPLQMLFYCYLIDLFFRKSTNKN